MPGRDASMSGDARESAVGGILAELAAPKKRLRRLPPTSDTVETGDLRIAFQSVGNTAYTKGVYVYAHRQCEDEAKCGYLSWSAAFDDAGRFFWRRNVIRGLLAPDIEAPDIVEAAECLLDRMPERDPIGWMFHANSALQMELEPYDRRRRDIAKAIVDLEAAKAGVPRGRRHRGCTSEQLDRSLGSRRRDLSKLDDQDGRMRLLRGILETIQPWFSRDARPAIRASVSFSPRPATPVPQR